MLYVARLILYSINASTNKITSHVTLLSNTQFLKGVGEIILPFLHMVMVAYVDYSSLFETITLVEAMSGVLVPKTVCAQ